MLLLPLGYLLAEGRQVGAGAVAALVFRPYVGDLLRTTFGLVFGVTGLSFVLGVGLACLVERTDLPGRRCWSLILALPLAIPAYVSAFAWLSLTSRVEGLGGAIPIIGLAEYPLVFLPVAAALRGLDGALEDVACSLGQSGGRRFFTVILPQLVPAAAASGLLVALHMLVEFGPLALLRVSTFTTAIYSAAELEFDGPAAAVLSAVLLLICAGFVAAELRVRGRGRYARLGAGVRRRSPPFRLGRWTGPALVAAGLVATLAVAMPVATLLYWMTVGRSTAFPLGRIIGALGGSLHLAGLGSLVTTVCGLLLVLAARRQKAAAHWLDRLPYIVHALPGLVVALSLVAVTLAVAPFFYQGVTVTVVAYAILALPLAQSALRAVVAQVSPGLEEAGLATGRSPWHVFRHVTLPSLAPGLGSALVLVFLSLLKELTATLILVPTGTDTLAIEVWSHTSQMEYGGAAPYALLLVLVSGLPAFLFARRLKRHGTSA